MIFVGYFGAFLVGIVLGLIGGGGSVLTLPILVYLFQIDPSVATGYSLLIVGLTSLVGSIQNVKNNMIDYKTGILFSIPAFWTVFLTRKYIVPKLPDIWFQTDTFSIEKSSAIMVLFAIVMVVASFSMIKSHKEKLALEIQKVKFSSLIAIGIAVGLLAGFVGAGGGFLIIPALVFFAHLPMKKAVATSLMIISINSIIGFTGDISTMGMDWIFLMKFTAFSVLGIFFGIYFNKFIPGEKLKKGFGWFVLLMGFYIFLKEMIF